MPSELYRDSNGVATSLGRAQFPQVITVNAAGGAAVLSAAFTAGTVVRLTGTVATLFLFTTAGAVTSTTGHYLPADVPMIVPITGGATKVSVLGAGVSAGVCYISELL